jgi:prepilin-type N-terminal cleavage/methylation domain-containing protein
MKKGFTLIELLVVISIISLLSSIVLVAVQDSRDKARQTSYRQYIAEVIKSIELYRVSSTDGGPPDVGQVELSDLVDDYINDYIEYSLDSTLFIYVRYSTSLSSSYSCVPNQSETSEDYIVYLISPRSDLNFRNLYGLNSGTPYTRSGFSYYCASPSYK